MMGSSTEIPSSEKRRLVQAAAGILGNSSSELCPGHNGRRREPLKTFEQFFGKLGGTTRETSRPFGAGGFL